MKLTTVKKTATVGVGSACVFQSVGPAFDSRIRQNLENLSLVKIMLLGRLGGRSYIYLKKIESAVNI